jgi:Na+/phosphate symporter
MVCCKCESEIFTGMRFALVYTSIFVVYFGATAMIAIIQKPIAMQVSDLVTNVNTYIAAIATAIVTYFATKARVNKDNVDTADSKAKVEAIGEWKAIAEDRSHQIKALSDQNEILMKRNAELYENNQKLTYSIGEFKNQINRLETEVKRLSAKIGNGNQNEQG